MDKQQGGLLKFTRATAVGLVAIFLAVAASADDQTVVVSLDNANGWGFVPENPNVFAQLENGPAVPPLGAGSANLVVDNTGRIFVGTLNFLGLPLGNVNELSYWTYHKPTSGGSPDVTISLQFDMDYDSTDASFSWQGRLIFEPINDSNQPAPQKGVWQKWDALAGKWWMSGFPIVAGSQMRTIPFPQSSPGTWDEILDMFPTMRVRPLVGATALKAGGPWPGGFDGNVDAFKIGIGPNSITYDFEVSENAVVDSDGDGVPDTEDDYPNSDLSPTVVIDGVDTGVPNLLFENGATIADWINELAAEAVNHGHFVSNVAKLANALRKDGTLTNKESAALKRGAAKAEVP
jgi:hypothetical protein